MDTADPTQLDVNFMILADGAQSVGGKIYILGGGWTHLFVPQIPGRPQAPFAVALGISVPYHLTNRRYGLTLELLDADGQLVGDQFTVDFEQGRPPGLRPGTSQQVLLALNTAPEFPAAGRYSFRVSIDGQPSGSVELEVVQVTPPAPAAPAG